MIAACTGKKHLELEETSQTISQFLELITTGITDLPGSAFNPDYDQVVGLVHFLKKYECAAAIGHLGSLVQVPSAYSEQSIVRLLIAMHLDLGSVVATMIQNEPEIFQWLRPSGSTNSLTDFPPYTAFRLMPQRYMWALMSADVHKPESIHAPKAHPPRHGRPSDRFLMLLRETKGTGDA